jgi:uncharacterized protein (TIGR02466 family)
MQEVEVQHLDIFRTMVQQTDFPFESFSSQLRSEILSMREDDPEGIYRSNQAGTWHSCDQLLQKLPSGEELSQMFFGCFNKYAGTLATQPGEIQMKLSAWAMVYSNGGYATVHTHPNAHFSGVYYVDAGEVSNEVTATGAEIHPGDIEFVDTRGSGSFKVPGLNLQPAARITPKDGRLIVFPSWLPHFVHPVRGDHERIAVACNARILNFVTKE